MTDTANLIRPWEEHAFWLEILEDHAYFVRDHLSPSEQQYVDTANQYIQAFQQLRVKLSQLDPNLSFSSNALIEFSKEAWPIVTGYFQFEGHLQSLRVQNKVNLNLSPTYLNGTLGENQEYIRILTYYVTGQNFPPLPLVDLLDLWLEDQLGHAVLFRNVLDPIELTLSSQTEMYVTRFQGYIVQNKQMRSILRFSPPNTPRQQRLSRQIGQTTIDMYNFVKEVIGLYLGSEMFTRTTLRFLEHHLPETCYFIKKLSYYAPELSNQAAQCPLTKPSYT
ncbi:DUF2935 domain-containing protein [Anaerobacillus alkaliphilus]|uniref:DUF2935 domain-containing protein n=1 Tax=Anaerobacillus alkaliphilus TaxID=1548597 RepID=A0A4Q0VPL7_9BACI|nr:DUF2935 domain-containing protein [Anaerobacillus alkaliphilus]RXI97827.1 DUF2935 domain-containing protein [Anaerobacillus alkaliphilus]